MQRLITNEQHPNESPDHTRVRNRDLYHIVSIEPHPCSDKTFELADEEPQAYSTGLKRPDVIDYQNVDITDEEMASIPTNWDWRDHVENKHAAKAAKILNQGDTLVVSVSCSAVIIASAVNVVL